MCCFGLVFFSFLKSFTSNEDGVVWGGRWEDLVKN